MKANANLNVLYHNLLNNVQDYLIETPYDKSFLETGRRANTMLGSWSPFQLEQFVEYRSQDMNKTVVYVNPKHTSKICSKCGYIHKNNREGNIFHCLNYNFELHANLNAARNIEVLCKSEYFRLLPTSQSLRPVPPIPDNNKPPAIAEGSRLSHIYFYGKTF